MARPSNVTSMFNTLVQLIFFYSDLIYVCMCFSPKDPTYMKGSCLGYPRHSSRWTRLLGWISCALLGSPGRRDIFFSHKHWLAYTGRPCAACHVTSGFWFRTTIGNSTRFISKWNLNKQRPQCPNLRKKSQGNKWTDQLWPGEQAQPFLT